MACKKNNTNLDKVKPNIKKVFGNELVYNKSFFKTKIKILF